MITEMQSLARQILKPGTVEDLFDFALRRGFVHSVRTSDKSVAAVRSTGLRLLHFSNPELLSGLSALQVSPYHYRIVMIGKINFSIKFSYPGGVGRGCGVGRGLGVALGVVVGVAVALAVAVAVAVGVAVGVTLGVTDGAAVGVAVGVAEGVGVGVPPPPGHV